MSEKEVHTLHAISSGCYSDYRVHAVFGDRKTAKRWADAMNGDAEAWGCDYRVEDMVFVPAGVPPTKVTAYSQHVLLWDDGTIEKREMRKSTDYAIDMTYGLPPKRPHVRFVRAPIHQDKGGRLEVRGDSAEAVAKVVSERIAAWKSGAWVTRNLEEWTNEEADE